MEVSLPPDIVARVEQKSDSLVTGLDLAGRERRAFLNYAT